MIVRGNILTMDPDRPRAGAMAVRGGHVVAVGSLDEVRRAAERGEREVTFANGAILPGLIDSHNHMLWTGLQQGLVDLARCRSIGEIQSAVREYAAAHPDLPWLVGGRAWHIHDLAEGRYPTCHELDAACPDRPVYLPRGGHVAVVNTAAMKLAGLSPDTPDPDGGRIERLPGGEPTGVLTETPAMALVERHVPAPSHADRMGALQAIQGEYHAAGLTGVIDPALTPDELLAYQALREAGELTVRTVVMPLVDTADGGGESLERIAGMGFHTGVGDDRLRFGGLKVFLDGGASMSTALLRDPWPDTEGDRGLQLTDTGTLRRIASFCAERGWSLGVHAAGGGAIELALETFREVDARHPIRDLRFSLIHAYFWPTADDIRAAADLGVVVATQPGMQYRFAKLLVPRFGEDVVGRATPIRAWLDAGVVVGGGSDSPITPYDPLLGIWQAVTRHVEGSSAPLGEGQAISVEESLVAYTRGAAYLSFAERERGMLRPGMAADWIALSVDPLSCESDELREAEVLMTTVAGDVVFEKQS